MGVSMSEAFFTTQKLPVLPIIAKLKQLKNIESDMKGK